MFCQGILQENLASTSNPFQLFDKKKTQNQLYGQIRQMEKTDLTISIEPVLQKKNQKNMQI
jgi:hypothetical protein